MLSRLTEQTSFLAPFLRPGLPVLLLLVAVSTIFAGRFIEGRIPANTDYFPHSTIADFNNDGIPDIAGMNASGSGNEIVLLGCHGNGNCDKMGSKKVSGFSLGDIASGDFNGDGKMDVVIVYGGSTLGDLGRVSVFFGNGDGSLGTEMRYGFGDSLIWSTSVTVGDFNNDGHPDFAVSTYNDFFFGAVSIFKNDGTGSFPTGTTNSAGFNPRQIESADLNGDGNLDIAVAGGGDIILLYGNGSGGISSTVTLTGHFGNQSVAIGDFNNDGRLDLAYSVGTSTSTIKIFLNSSGGFSSTPSATYSTSIFATSIVAAYFDQNKNMDLAMTDNLSDKIYTAYGNGDGTFQSLVALQVKTAGPYELNVGDFDINNRPDIFVGYNSAVPGMTFLNAQNSARYFTDFDRDIKTDQAIFRTSTADWWVLPSGGSTSYATHFGVSTDLIVPAHYDDDARADIAVFRTGTWYILGSVTGTMSTRSVGQSGDKPVPADYHNEGMASPAVFRPSNNTWYVLVSSGATETTSFGVAGDLAVPGDYDGDGSTDKAVFRPSNGTWYILETSTGSTVSQNFGLSGDKPVQGDYDSDGKVDVAVFRPSNGVWYISKSTDGTTLYATWGLSTDVPSPGDYNGDGRNDFAVYRPSTGVWHIQKSSDLSFYQVSWGTTGDIPIPSAYVP